MSAATAEAIPAVRKARAVLPARFKQAEQTRNVWTVVPDEGTAYEDIFSPEYWSHNAALMRPGDLVEVRAEDGSYFALLYVAAVQRQAAAMVEIVRKDLNAVAMPVIPSPISVEFKGPMRKWSVIRAKDGVVVSDKHDTRLAADNAAADYLRTISR